MPTTDDPPLGRKTVPPEILNARRTRSDRLPAIVRNQAVAVAVLANYGEGKPVNSAAVPLVLRLCQRFSDEAERESAMKHEWILDVLTDLNSYARKHGLGDLAEQLNDARHVAAAEIAVQAEAPASSGIERRAPTTAEHGGEARSAL